MSKRAVILSTAVVFGFFIVLVRLTDIMLINHERLSKRARLQHRLSKDIEVARGNIYDRKGRELAVNIECDSLYCEPKRVSDRQATASTISSHIDIGNADLLRAFSSNKGFLWLKRKLDPETAGRIKALRLDGIGFRPEIKRFYPKASLGSHVVGSVGIDNQPLEAVELRYDDVLRKPGGEVVVFRDAEGWYLSEGTEAYVKGNSVVLTLDEALQFIAEQALDEAVIKWRASSATVIMMNPYNGEILALANRPTYDPNRSSEFGDFERRNKAITDLYEPGSTFKLVIASAAIEEGTVTLDTKFNCTKGSIKVGKWLISDVHKHGVLTFKEVLQKSSNVGAVMVGLELGGERLTRYAGKFGFGEKTGMDLPGEAQGWISRPNSDVSIASLSIGYGVAATPVQILRAYSAVANGGVLVTPHVVSEVRTPEGLLVSCFKPSQERRAISPETARTLREIFLSVTDAGGTAPMASLEGNRVAGKTGTVRLREAGSNLYSTEKYISSFVGFVPAENPRLAVIVVLHEPKGQHFGGVVAAPVFKAIAEKSLAYLNVPRDDLKEENTLVMKSY